jgi:hypothetical protein
MEQIMTTCIDTDDILLVRDDNGSQLECRITRDDTNTPVDLTGAIARLKFRKRKTTTLLFTLTNIQIAPVDLPAGQALFQFSGANLDLAAGLYEGEIEVTFSNANIETVFEIIKFQVRDDF